LAINSYKETSERKVEIKDFDPSVVEAMLCFVYSFDYRNTCGTSSMIFDAQVYQIADKYDIPALKAHSKEKFASAVAAGWNMDDFPLSVSVVYDSTPQEHCSDATASVNSSERLLTLPLI
jgi:speckle-type POZ protein